MGTSLRVEHTNTVRSGGEYVDLGGSGRRMEKTDKIQEEEG